ncbi:NosD domain-containing protein [Pseudomonas asiatica]|uniref:NosD domain-containing protein n=1 Tax=Pseudomonas asiatica TaxID=2219225 RepID=UPI0037CAF777
MSNFKCVNKLLILGLITAASQGCQSGWANESGNSCEIPNNGVVSGIVKLKAGCIYNQSIIINDSNVKVDCNGAVLDGQGERKYGVLIDSKGRPLSNVTVANCKVRNFAAQGVLVTSGVPDAKRSTDRDFNYSVSPTKVTLSNLVVERAGGVGVFLHSYVTNVTLKDSIVSGSKGAGIYLEHSSRDNKLIGNVIKNNGAWNGPKTGQREGLAIDSSARNLIEGNKFSGNSAGGIFLYKNCGEKFSQGRSVIRWQSSNDNIIKNNKFYDEKVGIWIASRQSRNQQKSDCGDPALDSEKKYFADYANHNTIQGNEFCRNKLPIKVEGDDNIITGNRSDIRSSKWVSQPETMKARLTGIKSSGNKIEDNSFEACDEE